MSDEFTLRQGDRLPVLRRTLYGTDGVTPLDLTGATVTFRMRNKEVVGSPIITGPCSIVGAATGGVVDYAWGANDSATPGAHFGEFRATFSGLPLTIPNGAFITINVTPAL